MPLIYVDLLAIVLLGINAEKMNPILSGGDLYGLMIEYNNLGTLGLNSFLFCENNSHQGCVRFPETWTFFM